MSIFEKAFITVGACDVLFSILAIPLVLGRVPPNPVYGFRTPRLLRDPEAWYRLNAHFGRRFLVASIGTGILFPVVTSLLSPPADLFLPISVLALAFPVIVAGTSTSRLLRALPPEPSISPRPGSARTRSGS